MINLQEQLKKYPKEFSEAMQIAKDKNIENSIQFILNRYKLKNEWENMKYEEQDAFMNLLKDVYSFGFFSGVSFTLDPDQYLEEEFKNFKKQNSNL